MSNGFENINPYLSSLYKSLKLDKTFVSGEGSILLDENGNEYYDFVAGFGSIPFGHNYAPLKEVIIEALQNNICNFAHLSIQDAASELAEQLLSITPKNLRRCTFGNSGTEAVEIAIKLAKSATGKNTIVSALNSFHGKTMGSLMVTGKKIYREPFYQDSKDYINVPFGNFDAINECVSINGDIAAIILEPIQAEGGVIVPPEGYLKRVEQLCKKTGIPLIIDEIQTGLGRCGKMFETERENIKPDILTVGKALSGGLLPISACLCSDSIWNDDFAINHSSTFAGNFL